MKIANQTLDFEEQDMPDLSNTAVMEEIVEILSKKPEKRCEHEIDVILPLFKNLNIFKEMNVRDEFNASRQ